MFFTFNSSIQSLRAEDKTTKDTYLRITLFYVHQRDNVVIVHTYWNVTSRRSRYTWDQNIELFIQ